MRDIDVSGTPTMIKAVLQWTGDGPLQLMVNDMGDDGTLHEFVYPAPQTHTDEKRLSLSVPAASLHEGTWQFMPRTAAAADVHYTLSVEIGGGAMGPTQHHDHWPTMAEYVQMHAEGHVEQRAVTC